jgi:hypothetical protein
MSSVRRPSGAMPIARPGNLPVVTVSRRTDMVRWYPDDLVRILEQRYPPGAVHSIVVITKFPGAVLARPVRLALSRYELVVIQVTVTGLGGTRLEPGVDGPETALAALPGLLDLTGSAERVTCRIDPIVHWREAGALGLGSELRSNLEDFGWIARLARQSGVTRVKTSLASPYPKVLRRFERAGLTLVDPQGAERERVLVILEREATTAGVALEFCCEPSRAMTACIDERLLSRLHPRRLPANADRAGGQRVHCGCSRSVDLAWYSSHPCPSGCLYCYANPRIGGAGRADRPTRC